MIKKYKNQENVLFYFLKKYNGKTFNALCKI